MNYKLKLLETVETVLNEIDASEAVEDKASIATWFSEASLDAAASVVGYSRLHPDMRKEVRKGIAAKHDKVRSFLKGK
jgi:hypothetical protein